MTQKGVFYAELTDPMTHLLAARRRVSKRSSSIALYHIARKAYLVS